jgi:hypothetical protein
VSVIRGENAILYWKVDGYFKPIACMESCNVTTNTELSETSTVQTGTSRTYRGNRNTWTVTCQGLCSFDENHPHVKLRQLQQKFTPVQISFTATDENGISETFSGKVLITSLPTDSAANDFYTYSIEATGTGKYTITDIPVDPNECCQDAWIYYTGNGTEGNSITSDDFKNVQIAGRIYRDGTEYRPSGVDHDGTGVPVGKQFKHDPATGTITFDATLIGIASGEQIDIPYNLCGSTAACDIVISDVMPVVDTSDSNKFHITFLPTIGVTPTAPDDVKVRYSTDDGTTWQTPTSITYDPGTNYQLVTVNDALDTTESYLFEVTPICNGVEGTAGTGYSVCIAVHITPTTLPDAVVGVAYNQVIELTGTPEFSLSDLIKPSWMTVTIVGSEVFLTGTPTTIATGDAVSFTVTNCNNKTAEFTDTFNVIVTGAHWLTTQFISGDDLNNVETQQIQGEPGADVTITVTNYINNNGGSLTVDSTPVTAIGETLIFTLDAGGFSPVITITIAGHSTSSSIILGKFTITSVTAGTIGSPADYTTQKVF